MIPFPVVQAIRNKARIAAKKASVKELTKLQKRYERISDIGAAIVVKACIELIQNKVKPIPNDNPQVGPDGERI